MGIFSEVSASIEAKGLEEILKKALNSKNFDIIKFCKDNVYPLYISAKGDAFENLDKYIEKEFGVND